MSAPHPAAPVVVDPVKPLLCEGDMENLRRAADLLDAEAQTWREGFAFRDKGSPVWIWDGKWPDIEARVMRLENSSRFLRQIHAKILKRHFGCRTEPPAFGNSDTTARNGDRQTAPTASDSQPPKTNQ